MNIKTLPQRIRELVKYCLFKEDEIKDGKPKNQEDCVTVHGIVRDFGFHKGRLADIKQEIQVTLSELVPDSFLKNHGGGMSFLNFCEDKDGRQWTGDHGTMEELFCLAMSVDLGGYCMEDRELWSVMPGSMPYIYFDLPKSPVAQADDAHKFWDVVVQKTGDDTYRTVFKVGEKTFYVSTPWSSNSEQHCNTVQQQFLNALGQLAAEMDK